MKKWLAFCLSLVLLFAFPVPVRAEDTPSVSAEAFVLYCVESGEIILSKNENKPMKPASTTKLMTVLLTLEEAAKNDRLVTFTEEMTAEGSSMYLKLGERVRLSDLAAGMMMVSGNDAANAAAIALDGSMARFAERMNRRAAQIGMANTHFVTPSGLDDDRHYTTAHDMALLMTEGLQNKDFAALTFQKSVGVAFAEPQGKQITYSNHNRLLRLYDDCIGGKTGYTTAAGRCLVSAARRGGVTLVCVTLNDRNDWNDHIALFDYGFAHRSAYQSGDGSLYLDIPCVGGEKDSVAVMGESDASLIVPGGREADVVRKIYIDSFVYAPVKKGDAPGHIDYSLDGKLLKSVPLIAAEDVTRKRAKHGLWKRIKELFTYG